MAMSVGLSVRLFVRSFICRLRRSRRGAAAVATAAERRHHQCPICQLSREIYACGGGLLMASINITLRYITLHYIAVYL